MNDAVNKIDLVEKCAGHGGTFGVMKKTHNIAKKVGKFTANAIPNVKNILWYFLLVILLFIVLDLNTLWFCKAQYIYI